MDDNIRKPEPSKGKTLADQPVRIVHLRRADYGKPEVRKRWQDLGYATLGPMEGHDPYVRCPICSTDTPAPDKPPREDCSLCGQGPCAFTGLPRT